MKKGLMLSLAASAVLFAGGDIAPVEPVAEAPAAACDFYGQVGAYAGYDITNKSEKIGFAGVLGVERELTSGLTLGFEVQGLSNLRGALDNGKTGADKVTYTGAEMGNISQLFLRYNLSNTSIMVGRFEIKPDASPLVNSKPDALGLKKTYNGLMIANSDIADTVIYGGYLFSSVSITGKTPMNAVFAGFQNKSFADTVITGEADYFVKTKAWDVALDVTTNLTDNVKANGNVKYHSTKAWEVGGYVSAKFGAADAKLAANYKSDKTWDTTLTLKTAIEAVNLTAEGKYKSDKSWEASLKADTEVLNGKACVKVGYTSAKVVSAKVGYSTTIMNVAVGADYTVKYDTAAKAVSSQAVSAKAVYTF
jgi:hypothetical protein